MSKKVAVLFSGGLDSTYLVWKNLKDGNVVTPIYIEIENNHNKTILEKNRVELLFKEFRNDFPSDDYEGKIRNINYVVKILVNSSSDKLYFKQMPIWMVALIYCQGLNIDEIQIGYIGNDDAIPYIDDIRNMYNSYQPICDEMLPLVFPLAKLHKFIIAEELPKKYFDFIVSCENPRIVGKEDAEFIEYEPCGYCVPCGNIIAGNYYGLGFPEKYKNAVKRHHLRGLEGIGYRVLDENNEKIETWQYEPEIARPQPYQLELPFEYRMELPVECEKIEQTIKIEKIQ